MPRPRAVTVPIKVELIPDGDDYAAKWLREKAQNFLTAAEQLERGQEETEPREHTWKTCVEHPSCLRTREGFLHIKRSDLAVERYKLASQDRDLAEQIKTLDNDLIVIRDRFKSL